jgi:hypothetical protein
MKKGFLIFAVIIAMVISACANFSSIPGGSVSYPGAVVASESATFTGSGFKYSTAREGAIEDGKSKGYTRIVAEVIERSQITGLIDVTLVMLK